MDILQNLLDEYDFKDVHSSIGMTFSDVHKSYENLVLSTLFKHSKENKLKIKFKVGYRVRIKKIKYAFGDKYDRK
jgi:glycosylphosphatidylinositol transamidase (GPIT) subunit GPI8